MKDRCLSCQEPESSWNHTNDQNLIDGNPGYYHRFISTKGHFKAMQDQPKLPQYRQGDVLLVPVASIPSNAKKVARDNGRLVLAYGEVTGHAHVIDAPPEEAVLLTTKENERFLNLVKPSSLKHEEHDFLLIPAGQYQQIPQEEWAENMERPEAGRAQRVVD